MANPILDSDLEQVLNLHRGIADRWAGPGSVNSATASLDSAFFGAERMLADLPGLAAVNGSFGADAWDLANFLTVEGSFGRTMSAEVRAMSVGDLADIVQLILEEEELAQLEQNLQAARTRARAQGKPAPRAAARAKRKAAPGLRRKIETVRRSLAQVRARVAKETARQQAAAATSTASEPAPFAGTAPTESGFDDLATPPSASGDSVSTAPGQVGTQGPVVLGLAETLRAFARTPAARASDSPISGATRMALRTGSTWHPQASGVGVGFQATTTRALHMAEQSAEMSMVEPGFEAPEVATQAESGTPTASLAGEISAPAAAPRLPSVATPFDAVTGTAAAPSAPARQHIRRQAPVAAARATMRQAARAGVAAQPLAATSPGRTSILPPTRQLSAAAPQAAADSPSVATWGLQTQAAPVAGRAPTFSALSGAVRLAGQQLQRHAAALASARISARSPRPVAADDSAGIQEGAAPDSVFGAPQPVRAPVFAADRFADLLARGAPEGPSTANLLPRLTHWLEAGDQLVSATGIRDGYAATESGAGETLDLDGLSELAAAGAPPTALPRTSTTAPAALTRQSATAPQRATAPSAGDPSTPAWLTPAAARATQQRAAAQLATHRAAAGAPPVTAAPSLAAAAGTSPALTAALPMSWTAATFDAAIAQTAPDVPLGRPTAAAWPFAGPSAVAPTAAEVRASSAATTPGGAGLAAIGIAHRVSERHMGGLDPDGRAPAWRPAVTDTVAPLIGMAPAALADAFGEATAFASRAEAPMFGLQQEWLGRFDTSAPAELRGTLGHEVGAGEWLLPGDDGYDQWFQEASKRPVDAAPSTPKRTTTAQRAPLATPHTLAEASPAALPALREAISPAASAGSVPTLGRADASSSPTLARAAAAAIGHVVERHERSQRTATHMPAHGRRLASPLAMAALDLGADPADVLGLTPGGTADAITPWLLRGALARLPAETRRALRIAGVESTEFVGLEADAPQIDPVTGASIASTPAASRQPTSETGAAAAPAVAGAPAAIQSVTTIRQTIERRAERQRATIAQAIARPEVRRQLRKLGSGALDVRQPAGLKAALALFGETAEGPVEAEVTRSFLERWFGGVEEPTRRVMKSADGAGDLVALSDEAAVGTTLRTASDRSMTTIAGEAPDAGDADSGQELVLSGLAGLSALRAMRGAGEVDAELLATGEVRESDSAATPAESTAAQAAPAAPADRRAGAVRLHDFSPVALSRGRRLLGRSRRAGRTSLVRGSRASRFGGRRVGYGGAGLGGGALLGLVAGDGAGDGFHGGGFGDTRMTARAERLSAAVSARRESAAGPVGRVLRPSGRRVAAERPTPVQPAGLPRDFQFGEPTPELVSPHTAMEQAARGASASRGGTAQARGQQAGAMARVLSVTATPSSGVLPLVAPAARALASVAAAKRLDESVVTSGSDPSAGVPIERASGGGGSPDESEATTDEQGSELSKEIDALAMKIARSVMVRIKRERERRGIHG